MARRDCYPKFTPNVCLGCHGPTCFPIYIYEDYHKDCMMCKRPFTVIQWVASDRTRRTEVCHPCSELENVCEVCSQLCRKGPDGFHPFRACDSTQDIIDIINANRNLTIRPSFDDPSTYQTIVIEVGIPQDVPYLPAIRRPLRGRGSEDKLMSRM